MCINYPEEENPNIFFLILVNLCAFQIYFYPGGYSKVYGYDHTFPVIYYQLTQTQFTD